MLIHSNKKCFFKTHPFRFNKSFLSNWDCIKNLEPCNCFEFAYTRNCPDYDNDDVDEDEFIRYLTNSDEWKEIRNPHHPIRYSLINRGTRVFRDTYVKDALKDFDREYYYRICDKNKTPRPGRMFQSLLGYLYPKARKPRSSESYFYNCLAQAENYVLKNFERCVPLTDTEVFEVLPKNTSAGYIGRKLYDRAMKKGEMLDDIRKEYYNIRGRIQRGLRVDDYCIYTMRGHLSDRLKTKTRPVWLVSAPTMCYELKYYQPFYYQLNNNEFFKKHVITGKGSMSRLFNYLTSNDGLDFYNTDISQWDTYRASWFHERMLNKLRHKLYLSREQHREFDFIIDQAIRTKVNFPCGRVFQKEAGIISGTGGTLLLNTLLNKIAGFTILYMMKVFSFNVEDGFCSSVRDPNWLGDDFAFFLCGSEKFDLIRFTKLMEKYFSVTVNQEKTVFAQTMDDRKFLGYQLKGGLLFRETKELFQSLLYSERGFFDDESMLAISFSRFFSYLLLGGINDSKFLDFFYYYMGIYGTRLENIRYIYVTDSMDNIFKLIKDIYNINIPRFSLSVFQKMDLMQLKYCLLKGHDLNFSDLFF